MKLVLLALIILWPLSLSAQPFPALYDVTNVSADDVLNIRIGASVNTDIIGALAPDQTGVEVIELGVSGKWGRVNAGEQSGWAAMRFLRPVGGPNWSSGQVPLYCYGTEPFWSLSFDPEAGHVIFERMGEPSENPPISQILRSADGYPPEIEIRLDHIGSFSANFTGRLCNDGMSDRNFGIEARVLWLFSEGLAPSTPLYGCCSLGR